jgi:hypothetical protein
MSLAPLAHVGGYYISTISEPSTGCLWASVFIFCNM